MEQHLNNKIEAYTMESSYIDADLPVEVRRAIGGWEHGTEPSGSSINEAQASQLHSGVPMPYKQNSESGMQRERPQIMKPDNALCGSLSDELNIVKRSDQNSQKGLVELQRRVELLQDEYKQLLHAGSLTPEKSLLLQQQMLQVKMQIMHGVDNP